MRPMGVFQWFALKCFHSLFFISIGFSLEITQAFAPNSTQAIYNPKWNKIIKIKFDSHATNWEKMQKLKTH